MWIYFKFFFYWARSRLKFEGLPLFFGSVSLNVRQGATVYFGRNFKARDLTKINVSTNGVVCFGRNVFFNRSCSINCHDKIEIGDNVQFGEAVLLYDHDHVFCVEEGVTPGEFKTSPIIIGSNCWLGSQVVLLRGTIIGEGSIVAAGSVVRGRFPAGSKITGRSVGAIAS